jgi:hypothetical protein
LTRAFHARQKAHCGNSPPLGELGLPMPATGRRSPPSLGGKAALALLKRLDVDVRGNRLHDDAVRQLPPDVGRVHPVPYLSSKARQSMSTTSTRPGPSYANALFVSASPLLRWMRRKRDIHRGGHLPPGRSLEIMVLATRTGRVILSFCPW